jgi:hypothetical protein
MRPGTRRVARRRVIMGIANRDDAARRLPGENEPAFFIPPNRFPTEPEP